MVNQFSKINLVSVRCVMQQVDAQSTIKHSYSCYHLEKWWWQNIKSTTATIWIKVKPLQRQPFKSHQKTSTPRLFNIDWGYYKTSLAEKRTIHILQQHRCHSQWQPTEPSLGTKTVASTPLFHLYPSPFFGPTSFYSSPYPTSFYSQSPHPQMNSDFIVIPHDALSTVENLR